MGRLTLNVLLSFAQFEREVTGERIRDKIAASKKKGMWMGGFPPLGYDVKDRKLIPNATQAAVVQTIFALYLEGGCVSKLKERNGPTQITSKVWTGTRWCATWRHQVSRGVRFTTCYRIAFIIGEIGHRKLWYPGLHQGIVPSNFGSEFNCSLWP